MKTIEVHKCSDCPYFERAHVRGSEMRQQPFGGLSEELCYNHKCKLTGNTFREWNDEIREFNIPKECPL